MKRRVLILCTANSCRSQMAGGFWRARGAARWEVFSAGLSPKGVHPLAVKVMREIGLDISGQQSRSVADFVDQQFDLVLTVCSHAEQRCPTLPNAARRAHWPLDDPNQATGNAAQRLAVFRRVRDEIAAAIKAHLQTAERA